MNKLMDIVINFLAVLFCKAGNYIIIAVAIINFILFYLTKKAIKDTDDMNRPQSDIAHGVSAPMQLTGNQTSQLQKMRQGLVKKYALYANITAIFPLLGILGTVAALVTYSDVTMMENLMVALSTTLLGVFFAIIFKGMDAELSGPIDVIIDNADRLIHDFDRRDA